MEATKITTSVTTIQSAPFWGRALAKNPARPCRNCGFVLLLSFVSTVV